MKLSKEARAVWSKEQRRYYKQHGVPMPEQQIKPIISSATPIEIKENHIVLCVRFGFRYGREYVERLRNMVSRHLTIPYEFVCLTDDKKPIEGVRTLYQENAGYNKQWWHKVHMFDPSLELHGRILYFDLDVVIHDSIDKLFINQGNQFLGIRDFNRKFHPNWKYLNSSVMSWTHGTQSKIYQEFKKDKNAAMRFHGDQDFIWRQSKNTLVFWPENWIQSYKWEIRSREELVERSGRKGFKTVWNQYPINDCCVGVFHGDPKPQDVPDKYVVDNWC